MENQPQSDSAKYAPEDVQQVLEIMTSAKQSRDRAQAAFTALRDELAKESDRGAILVATSILEVRIQDLIAVALAPNAEREDPLFSGANAPLSAFSAKIDIAFRLGLISEQLRSDLHTLRKIRNDCAHRPAGCSFEDDSIKDRTNSVASQHVGIRTMGKYSFEEASTRERYLETVSWINFYLLSQRDRVHSRGAGAKPRGPEFAYQDQTELREVNFNKIFSWMD